MIYKNTKKMKTLNEILNNYEKYEISIEDRLGARLCQFLTERQMYQIGFELEEGTKHIPLKWTRKNIIKQLEKDVKYGFEKALNKRGISASVMFDVVLAWNKILEEGLEDWDPNNYAMYGLPLFKATAVKYGFENPIGNDYGNEYYYSENGVNDDSDED